MWASQPASQPVARSGGGKNIRQMCTPTPKAQHEHVPQCRKTHKSVLCWLSRRELKKVIHSLTRKESTSFFGISSVLWSFFSPSAAPSSPSLSSAPSRKLLSCRRSSSSLAAITGPLRYTKSSPTFFSRLPCCSLIIPLPLQEFPDRVSPSRASAVFP